MAKRKRTPSVPLLLPHPADEFVGRRAELDELVRALQPGQTVTLVGEPGIGKRALAAAAIDQLRVGGAPPRNFSAGVITLPCEQYPEEHLLLSALARTLGGAAYPDPRATVAALLEGKRLLIVLENVDALAPEPFAASEYQQFVIATGQAETGEFETGDTVEDAGALGNQAHVLVTLHALLDNGQCGILLTTDAPDLARGAVIKLGPLSEMEGRALLATYDENVIDNLQDTTDVVDLLGGLPLSLKLAGNWMIAQDKKLTDLRAALDVQGLAALPPDTRRSAGLAAIVQLVVSALDHDARIVLRLLAMLPIAPLPAPMLAAIISPLGQDDSAEVAEEAALQSTLAAVQKGMAILVQLFNWGLLVEQDDNLQYCHYLVQQLAAGREDNADAAADQEFAARLVDMIERVLMFAELADEEDAAFAPGLSAHLLHLQSRLYDNELWTYVGDIGARSAGYFTLPGYWYELFDVTRLAYRAVRRLAESDARGVYLLGIGQALMLLGFPNDAAAALTEALEATAKSGDQELELGVLETLLPIYQETNATAAARQSAERILTLVEQRDDPHLLTQALAVLSQMLLRSEDQAEHLPRAIELAERALALQHSLGSQEDLLEAVLNASVVWSQAGDSTRALEYGEQAVDMARRLRNRALEAAALLQLGETYSRHGEPRRVLRTYEKALEAARRSNVKPLVALSSWRLANSVEQSGNGRAALKYYEQCLAALDPAEVRDPTPAAVQAKIAALRN